MEAIQQQQESERPAGPRVSVIVLSFHRGVALKRCLKALERSVDKERLQVIVLDPGAHDTSPAMDIEFPRVEFLRMPRNFGATKSLNIGIRSAKAELLLFLDPAVEVRPDTIVRLASVLEETREAGAVCPLLVDAAGSAVPQTRRLPDRDTLWRAWQDENAIELSTPQEAGPMVVVEWAGRKALLTRLAFLKGMNYFDARYGEWGGDLELAFQIRHAGKKTLLTPDVPVTDHSAEDPPLQWTSAQRATLAADRLNGVAHFLGKRAGFLSGLWFRVAAVLLTIARAIAFQGGGYTWSLLSALAGGQKIDGTQGTL
ncbi:MAG: glycosyltransferase family 2 protein [Acidobacteria bacterium]|nr:glycosyltransferase family 2 protein [Acidobacteriota bacterium]